MNTNHLESEEVRGTHRMSPPRGDRNDEYEGAESVVPNSEFNRIEAGINDEEEEEERDESDYETSTEREQEDLLSFSNFPLEVIDNQHVTVVTAFYRFVVVGTHRGDVVLLEAESGTVFRMIRAHNNPISDLSCDIGEKYVGSSDMSGLVTIHNISGDSESYRKDFSRSIKSISIHPFYGRRDERPVVVSSSDEVILITKTLFLGRNACAIHQKHGKVFSVRWCGAELIAWASEAGLTLFNYPSKTVLLSVPRPESSLHLELYNCSLVWEAPRTLTCGWGNWVQVILVGTCCRELVAQAQKTVVCPPILTHTLGEPLRVCGLAPFGRDRYIVLAAAVQQEGCVEGLFVRIVERTTFDTVYCARISTSYKHSLQFCLAFTRCRNVDVDAVSQRVEADSLRRHSPVVPTNGETFFVVCVDTIIKATPMSEDDHVEYLLGIGQCLEAYQYAQTSTLTRHDLKGIGWRMLHHLLSCGNHEEAILHLPDIIGYDYTEWETWIVKFDQRGLSPLLLDVVPVAVRTDNPSERIGEDYYELLLLRCLEKDVVRFRRGVQRFSGMYRLPVVCRAARVRYNDWKVRAHHHGDVADDDMRDLGDAYGLLLKLNGEYEEALQVLSRVTHSNELFDLIQERGLFVEAAELLPELFATNETKTLELLLTPAAVNPVSTSINRAAALVADEVDVNESSVCPPLVFQPSSVVKRLEFAHRGYLWSYLKALRACDKLAYKELLKVHVHLVATLFIENEPSGMLEFLQENCAMLPKLKEIYALCKKNQMLDEMVFLLLRMGMEEEGLHVIVHEMKNMRKAVQFVSGMPNKEDQPGLYKKLVHMALEANSSFPIRDGQRYVEHVMRDGETMASIAQRYGIDEGQLRAANPVQEVVGVSCAVDLSNAVDVSPSNGTCVVPLDLTKELLEAVVDMPITDLVTLDPSLIIELLPDDEPMPRVGNCLATVARSKANDVTLMEAVVCVTAGDLLTHFEEFYRQAAGGLRVVSRGSVCPLCRQPVMEGLVAFVCSHVYHMHCIVSYFSEDSTLFAKLSDTDVERFFNRPETFVDLARRRGPVRCICCNQTAGAVK